MPEWYLRGMNLTTRHSKKLFATAGGLLLATVLVWGATGAHLGWTKTSVVVMQHDDITGIDYPSRKPGFVAGVEVLAVGLGLSASFVVFGAVAARRSVRTS